MSSDPHFPKLLSSDKLKKYRCLLVSALFLSGQGLFLLRPAIAMPDAGTVIENQATGSFQNDIDPLLGQTVQTIESDKVTLTVAEIAGISVISAGISEAASTVNNAGLYQGDGTINAGDIVYYDYLITNIGNDPTQFFIPDSPFSIINGTFDLVNNPIQVLAYNPTGIGGNIAPTTLVTVPTGGKRTGPDTATGTTGGLLAKDGIIYPGGSVTIRVPIKVNTTATAGQSVSVIMGNTPPNDNSVGTQNQVYLNNNNKDIYTQDNPDDTTNTANVVVETTDPPINGDTTNHRQEASATSQANVVLPLQGFKSVKLTVDADNSATISAGDTLTWTVSYINNGSANITNFQISDLLPSNAPITVAGAQTITINTIKGSTVPAKNTGYTGFGAAGASVNNLLASPITLVPGGVVTVSIPVKINTGTLGLLSNQSIATGTGLMVAGVKTDNVDRTTTNLPTGIVVPVDSVIQAQNVTIDATTATVLNTREYVVSPDRDKIIINEVLYSQAGGNTIAENDEFIELYNASTTAVDLSGWKLMDGNLIDTSTNGNDITGSITGSSAPFVFGAPLGTGVKVSGAPLLQPGQYAVIWIGRQNANTQITGTLPTFQVWLDNAPKLNNDGDDVWLYDSQTMIVDYMTYGTSNAINTPPPVGLNLWDSTYPNLLSTAAADKGKSISLTPNGRTAAHTSACWEPTTSGAASLRCPGALPTRDTDPFVIVPTLPPPNTIERKTSVGVSNNGVTTSPNVILVKRITGLRNQPTNPNDGTILNTFVNDPSTTNDTHVNWPLPINSYPLGATNGGIIKPDDEVEYTIYFLSTGTGTAKNVLFCDRVPDNVTFIPRAFNNASIIADTVGAPGVDRGIAVNLSGTLKSYSNSNDGDFAYYFPPNTDPKLSMPSLSKVNCGGANTNGAVVVNLGNIPNATTPGTAGSYGFVRFQGRVK
jgi:uncharacterized repeat protein (TIGR01451 family)